MWASLKTYIDNGLAGKSSTGHNHSGTYDPAGTASAGDSAHLSAFDHGDIPNPTGATDGHVWTADGANGAGWEAVAGGGGGVTDHGALTGLADDDHTQYALADGSRGAFEASGAVASHAAAGDPHPGYALESALGDAAAKNTGTTAGTVAAGDDSRFSEAAAHVADTVDAHDASAVAVDVSGFTGNLGVGDTDVQAALASIDAFDLGGGGSLDGLSDVSIASASKGEIVQFNGTSWVDSPDPAFAGYVPANYYTNPHYIAASPVTLVLNRIYFVPMFVGWSMTTQQHNCSQVSAAAGTKTYRMGIYSDGGGYPASLVSGSECAPTTTGTGTAFIFGTSAASLSRGVYWLAIVAQGVTGTVSAGLVGDWSLVNNSGFGYPPFPPVESSATTHSGNLPSAAPSTQSLSLAASPFMKLRKDSSA
jgi:hypothetical protein